MEAGNNRPIIIKRKKVIAGGGHHGGAWKVAYADFVTAMMAFFMLMWLLNATTEQQRKGIADYFSPTIPINRVSGGGAGAFGGDNIFTRETLAQSGTGGIANRDGDEAVDVGATAAAQETASLEDLEAALLGLGGESALSDNQLRHVVTRLTDEGLVIEVFDMPNAPLFYGATDTPEGVTVQILEMIARILGSVTNDVAISGHVKAETVVRLRNPAWDVSTSRAARTRLILEAASFDPDRIARITGEADRDPIVSDSSSIRNNRIEIVVLRSDL
ncbi:chemotaxis protein MotB [Cognatiyoonia koreensis]|uniref:Chemotaxis protein MotB n=1 Tax=Cognatiyoonia koreensis TaxID=364200 RepID=A0A1I0RKP7_9RHOB|nr:flagellar motor protein MotB [Cognatiyoonia koreensis]SEW41425.1 chemotaxis protein MotB [Cognatiyoonia koreensis]